MTVAAKDPRRADLSRSDLRKYPREVADVLLEAVGMGVPYRVIDGGHLRLYNGDREVMPFKVSSSRPANQTLPYLRSWLEENWHPWSEAKAEEVTPESLSALREHWNGPDEGEDTSDPESAGERQHEAEEPESEWVEYRSSSGNSHGFLTNGSIYRCATCGYEQDDVRGLHLHAATHAEVNPYTAKSVKAKAEHRERREMEETQQKVYLQQALAAIVEHHGYAIIEPEHVGDHRRVTELEEQVASLTRERDELQTRLALLKEALEA